MLKGQVTLLLVSGFRGVERLCPRLAGYEASPSRLGGYEASVSRAGGYEASASHVGGQEALRAQVDGYEASPSRIGGYEASASHVGGYEASASRIGGYEAPSSRLQASTSPRSLVGTSEGAGFEASSASTVESRRVAAVRNCQIHTLVLPDSFGLGFQPPRSAGISTEVRRESLLESITEISSAKH